MTSGYPTGLLQYCSDQFDDSWTPNKWQPATAPLILGNNTDDEPSLFLNFQHRQPVMASLQDALSAYFNNVDRVTDAQCLNKPVVIDGIYAALAGLDIPSTVKNFKAATISPGYSPYNIPRDSTMRFLHYSFGFTYESADNTQTCSCVVVFEWQDLPTSSAAECEDYVRWYALAFWQDSS